MLLDAAMGTRLIARGLDLSRDDPALWCLDRPGEVARVHRLDVEAGADAVTTNTFGANRDWLARYGRAEEVGAINRVAAALARQAAGPDRFVLGCIGPTAGAIASGEQAAILDGAGADALILETGSTADRLGPRLRAIREASTLPVVASFALVDGGPLPAIDFDPDELGLVAVGWNCVPFDRAAGWVEEARGRVGLPLVVQPSAEPDRDPGADPLFPPDRLGGLLASGVRLLGGCCGSTDRDVAALRSAIGPAPGRAGPGGG